MKRKNLYVFLPFLFLFLFLHAGCAIGKFGKAEVSVSNFAVPNGIVGQGRGSVMKILGDPNFIASDKGTEYWGYRNHNGWYIYLYYLSGGKTEAKDLVVEFSGGKATTAYLIDKGSSFGIFAAPLAVGN